MNDEDHRLAERMARMEGILERMETAMSNMANAITELVRLDQKQIETANGLSRAFAALKELEARIATIELAIPILNLTSGWVRSGVVAVVGIVGFAIIYLVLK